MSEIVKYGVCGAVDAKSLAATVERALSEGWELQGGMAVGKVARTNDQGKRVNEHFFQAMIRRKSVIKLM